MRRLLLAAALAAGACDRWDDGRVARLEAELNALRAAQSAAPPDVAGALAPLREAIELMLRRSEVERTRASALTAELAHLAGVVQGFVDEGRRVEVETLRGRIGALEQQLTEQGKAQAVERELLLRALEATAVKLEAFLRQVGGRGAEQGAAPPEQPRRSALVPVLLASVAGVLLLVLAVGVRLRRRARAVRVAALELPFGPDAVVDAPGPLTVPVRAQHGGRGPLPVRVEVGTDDLGARERVRQWLAAEPRVLKAPAPEVETRGALLQVRFFVQDGMPAAERASLVADVLLRGQSESHAGRGSA